MAASDSIDDGARRLAGFEGDADHPAAARLDDIAADNRVLGPVGAFDEHIGLEGGNHIVRRLFVEDDDAVDTGERLERPRRARPPA